MKVILYLHIILQKNIHNMKKSWLKFNQTSSHFQSVIMFLTVAVELIFNTDLLLWSSHCFQSLIWNICIPLCKFILLYLFLLLPKTTVKYLSKSYAKYSMFIDMFVPMPWNKYKTERFVYQKMNTWIGLLVFVF